MMIDKEVYRGMSPRDSLIMKMARNEVEIDEVIEAREFLDALKKAREDGYKGSDKDFAKEYYRDAFKTAETVLLIQHPKSFTILKTNGV